MMTEKRQTYTAEFTCEAVRLVTEHGYGVGEAARNLGLNANMLQRWKRELAARETGCSLGKGVCPRSRRDYIACVKKISGSDGARHVKKALGFVASESK